MMETELKSPPPVPAPGNIGELATHFSYLRRDVDELKTLIKDQRNGYVTRGDFEEHLVADADHEQRIRTIEKRMWQLVGVSSLGSAVLSYVIPMIIKSMSQ